MIKSLLLLSLLLSCSTRKESSPVVITPIPEPVPYKNSLTVQFDCTLFGDDLIPHVFPGSHCVFQDDGSIISGTNEVLRKIGLDNSIIWELKKSIHHQINLSVDKKRILTLSSEVKKIDGLRVRDDLILILDQDGKVLHEQTGLWLVEKIGRQPLMWSLEKTDPSILIADSEATHFNSIYEIPENAGAQKASYLKPGNIIINSIKLGTFILSPDLKKLLFHTDFIESWKNMTHDVQVAKDGTLLYFNNMVRHYGKDNPHSSIDKYDTVKKEMTFRFTSDPKEMFYATFCGGVQEIGDNIFFSHLTNGGFLYSPSQKKMLRSVPPGNRTPLKPVPRQQIKMVDVREFMTARKINQ